MQVHFMLQQRLLLRLVALTLSLVLSSHSFASAYSCLNSSTSDFGSAINATVSVTESPFRTPSGPQSLVSGSNSWQWTLATESFYAGEKNVSISQNLWLDTQPLADLYSADFGYLGCGIVIHGLKTSVQQKAVVDRASGTCNSVLSYDCGVELFDAPIDYARNLSGFEFMNITDICRGFTLLGGRWKALGVTEKCMDDLTKDAWIETFRKFNSALNSSESCTFCLRRDNGAERRLQQRTPLRNWNLAPPASPSTNRPTTTNQPTTASSLSHSPGACQATRARTIRVTTT